MNKDKCIKLMLKCNKNESAAKVVLILKKRCRERPTLARHSAADSRRWPLSIVLAHAATHL